MKSKVIIIILLVITTVTGGCGRNQGQIGDVHDHTHDETLQLFAYSEDFEIFAESSPFVVGQDGEILVHVTCIENFKPFTEGLVSVSLVIGDEIEVMGKLLEEQERPGIWLFSLKPQKEGVGKLLFELRRSQDVSQVVIPNITIFTSEHLAHEAAAQAAITSADGITFTKEQSWKVEFATDLARLEPFGQIIRTTAQIQPSQGSERIISAKAGGVVLFTNDHVVEGRAVGAGQVLFSIDGSVTADNNLAVRYAEVESEYNRSKVEYERKAELAKENIVSQSALLSAKNDFTQAEANFNNLKSNFSAGRQSVMSPIGGFVTRVLVQNGEYVEAGQPVLVVSQSRDLYIKAEVQPKYHDMLNNITSATIRVMNSNRTYTLEELGGRVLSFGKSTDLHNPLIPVVFQVNNRAGWLSGTFVELFIKTQTIAQVVTIPNGALTEEMGNYFVFVQLTPELFEKRWIMKGVTDGLRTEILEGVAVGERVVSKGAMLVKLSQASGALDPHAGHVH